MKPQFEPGRYLVRIVDQCFTESSQKGTLGFSLLFRVLRNLNNPETPVKELQRDTTWWITDKTFQRVLHDLHTLGYSGSSLAGVDPDSDNFHDFRNQEIELDCTHENDANGNSQERWSLRARKAPLKDKSKLRQFDDLLAAKRARTNSGVEDSGQLISDDDVPF